MFSVSVAKLALELPHGAAFIPKRTFGKSYSQALINGLRVARTRVDKEPLFQNGFSRFKEVSKYLKY